MAKELEFNEKVTHLRASRKLGISSQANIDYEKLLKNYRPIEEKLGRSLYNEEFKVIQALQQRFSSNDFFFQINDSGIIFWLRSVDLNGFKVSVDKLCKQHGLDKIYQTDKNPFSDIIDKVERIGSYGIKGGKRIYVGYNRERKVENRQSKVLQRCTYFYARGDDFTEEINAVPEEFENRIICGDSEEILKKLPSNCIDLMLTSPPYNFGLGYDTSEDGISWEKYFKKLFAVFGECIRVLKYGGRIVVNVQPLFSDYIPCHHMISNFFMENKMIWKGEILWEKHNYNCKYTAWGSWRSPSNPYLKYTWEFLEIFCKGDLKKRGVEENIDIGAEEFKQWVFARWSIVPERNMKKYNHPAMFPEELARRVLKLFSYKNDIVLDPFNGVGTTTVVAKKLGRRFLGIDISEEYCRTGERRLRETL
jgi:DNA modification methylase